MAENDDRLWADQLYVLSISAFLLIGTIVVLTQTDVEVETILLLLAALAGTAFGGTSLAYTSSPQAALLPLLYGLAGAFVGTWWIGAFIALGRGEDVGGVLATLVLSILFFLALRPMLRFLLAARTMVSPEEMEAARERRARRAAERQRAAQQRAYERQQRQYQKQQERYAKQQARAAAQQPAPQPQAGTQPIETGAAGQRETTEAPQAAVRTCSNCGTQITDPNAQFCSNCGNRL